MSAETPGSTPPTPPTAPPARSSRLFLLGIAVVALVALFWPRGERAGPEGPGGFLVDEAGRPASLVAQLGEGATLVHFWATWCPPCQVELPELVRFAEETRESRLEVLFVAVADEPEVARRFLAAPAIPLYFDPTWEVAHRFGTKALPETHLVVDGEVVQSFVGATSWNSPAVRQTFQNWTARPTSPTP